MKNIIRWAVLNPQAMNIIMLGTLVVGAWSMLNLRRDFWPELEVYTIGISVSYPGASPDEIEEGILEKVEEAIHGIDGIDEMTGVAREGLGTVVLELESDVTQNDAQRILAEVNTLIDQIPSLPELAEEPDVRIMSSYTTAIRVAVLGPDDPDPARAVQLRNLAERVRNDILAIPSVSVADFAGAPDFEIDIEIPEHVLRQYNLSLADVAETVRDNNLELPGGTLKSQSQEILLRGSDKREFGEHIASIPLVTEPGGAVLTVGDIATVRDEFVDEDIVNRVNGLPAVVISVETTSSDDLIQVATDIRNFVEDYRHQLPDGFGMVHLRDRSTSVVDRLEMLAKNGWMGLVLVFFTLTLFLEMRLAWWVAMGIPVALLGACIYMLQSGQTLNMTSMFAFLIALGIVVDDAIVVGENIYAHRQMGKSYQQAAIDGATEVMPSVVTSVLTTVIAFMPIMYLEGRIQRMTVVLPLCVSAMLLISLVESVTILPAHLAHRTSLFMDAVTWLLFPLKPLGWLLMKMNAGFSRFLDWFIAAIYVPVLRLSLRNPAIVVSSAAGLLILSIGVIRAGVVPFLLLPKLDFSYITCQIMYPDGTPARITDEATRRLEAAIRRLNQKSIDEGLTTDPEGYIKVVHRTVGQTPDFSRSGPISGSHIGGLLVQLNDLQYRKESTSDIVRQWREEAGRFPGAESVAFGSSPGGPAAMPIEIRLMATSDHLDQLEAAIARCQEKLAEYPYVSDIATDTRPGKWEYRLKVRDDARSMGVSLADLAQTVRSSYYGEEVMRLQRGRHEVQLRVRYPREERRTLASFEKIRVRMDDRLERPLSELADVDVQRGYSEISRVNQMRAIMVVADVDEARGNAFNVVTDLQNTFVPEFKKQFPNVRLKWEGQQEQTTDSVNSLTLGFLIVLGAMFLLLTIQFGSYSQALLILSIIPFGFIGAILGHIIMGFELTLFSIFGLVALAGVVVNDSIVLVDFINRSRGDGLPLHEALLDAGQRRFRAVLLTSVTTVAGMAPILLERSKQSQVVAPMATSLSFGLMTTTVLVLILVPVMYLLTATISPADPGK
ncbi:MAG: efflux RND transporter permease subunit [Planctomycetaceae bacterium]